MKTALVSAGLEIPDVEAGQPHLGGAAYIQQADEPTSGFWARFEANSSWSRPASLSWTASSLSPNSSDAAPLWGSRLSGVQRLIVQEVSRQIGPQWTPVALKIASTESGFDCAAPNGGVFQVTHPTEFGITPAQAQTCAGGVAAGVAHMQRCLRKGVTDAKGMYVCHNSGSPRITDKTRLSPAYWRLVRHAGDLALLMRP